MARLDAFARSDSGRFYALVCDRWRVDPAAGIAEDFVAFNLRAALANALHVPTKTGDDEDWDAAGASLERAWLSA